ncbi:MAG: flagellar hook-basal body complex protein FliE [Bacillota bacterium]
MYLRAISMPSLGPIVERPVTGRTESAADPRSSFTSILQKASQTLDQLDKEAAQAQLDLVTGSARDLHTAALSAEKASLALDLVVSVRNKAIEAYQEIMRMPV